MKQAVHHRGAARVGQQLAVIADEAARRRIEDEPHAAAAGGTHLDELALALGHLLHDDAGVLLVDVDQHLLDRLEQLAGRPVLKQDLRPRHGELKTFTAHGFDEDAELQFAAAGDLHRILLRRFGNPQRNVALRLTQQPLANHPALHLVALGAGERGIVDAEGHRQGRRIDRLRRERLGHFRRAQRVRDGRLGQAGDGDDVAGGTLFDRRALEAAEGEDLGGAPLLDQVAVAVQHLDRLVRFRRAR